MSHLNDQRSVVNSRYHAGNNMEGICMRRWKIWLATWLCVVLGPVPAAETAAAMPKGSLVIIGGALRADNAEVWDRIVKLAGGAGARIAVLPTAAGNPERS